MSGTEVLTVLAKSVVAVGLLMAASSYTLPQPTPLRMLQWVSWICVLSGLYYVMYYVCRQCDLRRGSGARLLPLFRPSVRSAVMLQPVYTDVPQNPPAVTSEYADDPPRASLLEMSAASVYTYVYGWGILLFVCLYCMTGLHEESSCWWIVGMLVLAFDDLIMQRVQRLWVVTLGLLLYGSVVSVWWGASGSRAANDSLGVICISIVLPVLSPFVFFSLRSTVRAVTRDVKGLLEIALPFLLIIAISVLLCTTDPGFNSKKLPLMHMGDGGGASRRALLSVNGTGHHTAPVAHAETPAPFGSSQYSIHDALVSRVPLLSAYIDALPVDAIKRYAVLLATPAIAYYTLVILANSVVSGYVTEFISAFMLVLTTKYAIAVGSTTASGFALACAGTCFVFIVLLRRSL
jgi:hypothetical protein